MDLIVWSGGADSTLNLLEYIINKKEKFECVYIELQNNSLKSKIEKQTRKDILKIIEKHIGYNNFIEDHLLEINYPLCGKGLPQPLIWIQAIVPFLNNQRTEYNKEYHNIVFGNIKGDCFWHVREYIRQSFINSYKALTAEEWIKVPNLYYPIEWLSKVDIIDKYNTFGELGKQVFNKIWTCENPIEKTEGIVTCGKCLPCTNLDKAKKDIKDRSFGETIVEYKDDKQLYFDFEYEMKEDILCDVTGVMAKE